MVIDEIQMIPELLNEVHRFIESYDVRFLHTGSGPGRLREEGRGGVKCSRLFIRKFPHMNALLSKYFQPVFFLSDNPLSGLESYVFTYVSVEIMREGGTRNLPSFTRFLEIAGLSDGMRMDYENLSKDIGVSRPTIANWFRILYDSLLAFEAPPCRKTRKRKAMASPKFYFLDVGVAGSLSGIEYVE